MTKYRVTTRPINLKHDFVTAFDTMFDEMINNLYQKESKHLNKDFFLKGSYPKCNVYSSKDKLFIDAAIPGLTKDQLSIEVKNGVLSINGSSANSPDEKNLYLFREIKKSSFQRSFSLSDKLDHSSVSAEVLNGILTISIDFIKPQVLENETFKVEIK